MGKSLLFTGVSGIALALATQASAATDCSGVEITVGAMNPPFIGGPAVDHGKTWETETGGTVNVVHFPFGELYTKFMTPMATSQAAFDVILHAPAWHGDFAPYLSEIPAEFTEGADWEDIHPTYRDRLMMWDGKQISVTIDGDVHSGTYRRDLFEDEANQAAFKEKYGYDLAPPETWDQYYDIAEFFTRPDDGLHGTAEAFVRGGQQFWFFFSHAAAYTNHPDHPGSMFFDPETMDAQINNAGWLKGLEDYIKSVQYSPPGALNFNSGDIRTTFASGAVAMNFDWGDTGTIGADPEQSQVAGNLGFFILPGSNAIYNYKTQSWDDFDEVVKSPFMAYGGWVASVPATSEQQTCAWDYVMWYTSPENSSSDVVTGGTGINPYRISHFENVDNWLNIFSEPEAASYLEVQRGSIEADNVALDFRLPGYFQYTEVLEIELSKALNGDVEPQAALDAIAEEWNRLTDEFGRDVQLATYRASMGLPPL
ncbi:MAG: extracellular solute-binding protein [Alphaproteobacteria bacterium]|nr:extracellular solute-binding protein [Alphaproteobacteria bacterium]